MTDQPTHDALRDATSPTDEWGGPSVVQDAGGARSQETGDQFDDTGREVAAVLRAAHASAQQLLDQAREQAERERALAEADARRIREAAAQEAHDDLRRIAAESEAEAQQLAASTQDELRRTLEELRAGTIEEIRGALRDIEEEQRKLQDALDATVSTSEHPR